jgi:hypothetical protein
MADYTTIDDPSAHFQIATWTGDGNADRAIVNDGNSAMQPDWVWYKSRSNATSHIVYDSSRGADYYLKPNTTAAEGTDSAMFESFDSDGFSLNADTDGNGDGRTYVAWQWKANGGTKVTVAESGSGSGCVNACTHQANTTAGVSIITYTGRDDELSNGQESHLTHGLGVAPTLIILKRRDATADWYVMGKYVTSASAYSNNEYLSLNDTDAINGNSYTGDTAADSTHIFLGNELVNVADATYVCYAFTDVQGYSKFGKYKGNGASDAAPSTLGPFIYTGFSPALVIIKKASAVDSWYLFDNKRAGYDPAVYRLYGESTSAETGGTNNTIQFTSNGFKVRFHGGSLNESGGDYVYMAWAEQPFVSSTDTNSIPATAR